VEGKQGSIHYQTNQAKLIDMSGRALDCGYVAKFVRATEGSSVE
jgi:hypothetical protein